MRTRLVKSISDKQMEGGEGGGGAYLFSRGTRELNIFTLMVLWKESII